MTMNSRLMLAAALLAGCDANTRPSSSEELGTLIGREDAVTVLRTYFSGLDQPTSALITSSAEWSRIWDVIHSNVDPRPALPAIDFSREALVLIGLGTSPGVNIEIDAVRVFERGVVAEAILERYSERCLVLTAMGNPVHVVRIPRPDGSTLLVENSERVLECD